MIVALSLIIPASTTAKWFSKNMSYNAICYYVLKECHKDFSVLKIKKIRIKNNIYIHHS